MANDLLMIPVAPYIDDLTAAETELSKGPHHRLDNGESRPNPGSGDEVINAFAILTGIPLSKGPGKETRATQIGVSCGVETDLRKAHINGSVPLRIKESSRIKALKSIKIALESDTLSPTDAESLSSKIGYVLNLGKIGKAALQPIFLSSALYST